MKIDLIIISYNSKDLTLKCIETAKFSTLHTIFDLNVIVVDNKSNDGSIEVLSELEGIHLITNEKNLGYAKAVNIGMAASNSEFAIISNADVEYLVGSIEKIINFLQKNPNAAACGPQQVFPSGKWQRSFGLAPGVFSAIISIITIPPISDHLRSFLFKRNIWLSFPRQVSYIDGAVLCVRREHFHRIGGFDEDFFFYTEEVDFCYRLRAAGFKIYHLPTSRVIHHRGVSYKIREFTLQNLEMLVSSRLLFCKKHRSKLETILFFYFEKFYFYILRVILKIINLFSKKETIEIKLKSNANFLKAMKQVNLDKYLK